MEVIRLGIVRISTWKSAYRTSESSARLHNFIVSCPISP